jgi:hypothetical protein
MLGKRTAVGQEEPLLIGLQKPLERVVTAFRTSQIRRLVGALVRKEAGPRT